jgi:DNA-binding MarR family transcriptional regulator
MWYSGNDSINDRLMYATSYDGINWTKHGVVLSDLDVRPNTVMKDGTTYKLWYQILVDGHWRIFYAISYDGINWVKQGMVLDIGNPGELDDMHVSGASVLKENKYMYKMWYSGHYGNEHYRIFYATSYNGINWIKHGLTIDLGEPGDKDENGAAYPNVIKDVDGNYKIWYSGIVNGYDTNIMHAISQASVKENGRLTSIKISLPSGQSWKNLVIDKTEVGGDALVHISILDGATYEPISGFQNIFGSIIDISSIDNVTHQTLILQATFVGDGSVSPILNGWGVTWFNPQASSLSTPSNLALDESWAFSAAVITAAVGSALFFGTFAGGTEVGRYKLIPLTLPLYSRLKKEEVLDQFTRGRIYEYIRNNPGDHYNSIKQELNLNNGVLAYHLKTLEREDYIKSTRDGIYKRFYPLDVKVQRVNGFGIRSVQGRIIMHLIQNPGLTQREISGALNISQQVVSYHLNLMMETGHIRAKRQGKTYRYLVNELIPRTNM